MHSSGFSFFALMQNYARQMNIIDNTRIKKLI